jgi:hypothetical protein
MTTMMTAIPFASPLAAMISTTSASAGRWLLDASASAVQSVQTAPPLSGAIPDRVLLTPFRSMFLVLFGGTLLLLAVRRLRAYKLRERYAVVFGLLGLPFIGLAFWPDGIGWLAEKLNIQYNTLALIGVTSFLFLAVFELLSIVSQQDQKITALAQLVGILMEQQKLVEKEHRPGAEEAGQAA